MINGNNGYPKVDIENLNGGFLVVEPINIINTSDILYGYTITGFDKENEYAGYSCSKATAFPEDVVGTYYSPVYTLISILLYGSNKNVLNSDTSNMYAGVKSFSIDEENVLTISDGTNQKSKQLSEQPVYFRAMWGTRSGALYTITKHEDITDLIDSKYKHVEISDFYKEYLIKQIFAESDDLSEQIKSITRPLYGKTLIVFGDSEMQYLSDTAGNIQKFKDALSISNYKSYAVAGWEWETNNNSGGEPETDPETATTGIHGQYNSFMADVSNGLINASDVGAIIWMMGTNGHSQGTFWEDDTTKTAVNTDITTMCGAMHEFFRRVLEDWTRADVRLMGIIPLQGKNRSEYFSESLNIRHNLLRDGHRCWSIPYLDGNAEFEIPAYTALNVDNGTMGDIVHWSPLGESMAIRKICGKLVTV